jgi:hypothetical protein
VKEAALSLLFAASALGQPRIVELPGKSPLVTIRLVFTTGAAADPANKPGLAHLTGALLGGGGTKDFTYKQILDAMYPMATSVEVYSDKEMTTFVGERMSTISINSTACSAIWCCTRAGAPTISRARGTIP